MAKATPMKKMCSYFLREEFQRIDYKEVIVKIFFCGRSFEVI